MKRNLYLVCPVCGGISEYKNGSTGDWSVVDEAVVNDTVRVDVVDGESDSVDLTLVDRVVKHKCGAVFKGWNLRDFSVVLINNVVKVEGAYWQYHRKDLERIIRELHSDLKI